MRVPANFKLHFIPCYFNHVPHNTRWLPARTAWPLKVTAARSSAKTAKRSASAPLPLTLPMPTLMSLQKISDTAAATLFFLSGTLLTLLLFVLVNR